ncbi:MAG TPA: class I SAM-dependent methyltransferase [Flavitalea sp.]|nr:class I SAM-dependent methyltransferase [Flavitalea sp.]
MKKFFAKKHEQWAKQKIALFLSNINLSPNASLLDLGGRDGAYMERIKDKLSDFKVLIADIDQVALSKAQQRGYETRYIDGSKEQFPFGDGEIDCIFCNSVIEHVTIPKEEVWQTGNNFRQRSLAIQRHFANEIRRCSKSYYVQTPHRHFPIEAHTWFPLIGYMPRVIQVGMIKILNKFWFKRTSPDWNLLDEKQMKEFFPDAKIFVIKKLGFKKEIIAIKPFEPAKANVEAPVAATVVS